MNRIIRISVGAALMALGATTTPADAQTTRSDAWQLALQLPTSSQTLLSSRTGLTWEQMRRNGLNLAARGPGEISLVMFVLAVEDGRTAGFWTSSHFGAEAGASTVSGRHVPSETQLLDAAQEGAWATLPGLGKLISVASAARPVDARALVNGAKDGGHVTSYLPRNLTRGRLLVMFVAPPGGGSGSQTNPLFLRPEQFSD